MTVEPNNERTRFDKLLPKVVIATSILYSAHWFLVAAIFLYPLFETPQNFLPYAVMVVRAPQTYLFNILIAPLCSLVALFYAIKRRIPRAILILAAISVFALIIDMLGMFLRDANRLASAQFFIPSAVVVPALAAFVLAYKNRYLLFAATGLLVVVLYNLFSDIYALYVWRSLFLGS